MDYEKKYKEALSRAKGMWEQGMMPERIEYIFPELKESEDEKVRKEIIDYCHERLNTTYGALPNIETIKRWLAWLEKQGEQKPAWNGEDEAGFGNALWAIEQARSIAKDENDVGNLWYAERWLKSVKERMKGE